MIEVNNLVKTYGTHTAIDHLSFSVNPGEIVGLLGPNGAGKTTTMRILTGFMPPTSGTAVVAGHDVMEDSIGVRRHVGYMPEQVPIYPDMTVRDYVTFWARLRGMRRPSARVDEVLAQVDLLDRRRNLVRSLSKGLRQRLGLAQALVHNPDVIILDEPTIGIDPMQVIEVRELVRSLRTQHTVLFSSHILSEVEQICDRVIIINKGRIVAQGTTEILSRQLKPGMHLYIAVSGTKAEVEMLCSRIEGILSVTPQNQGYLLTAKDETDIRGDVAQAIADHGMKLLEMRTVEITLEDIFRNVVAKGR